MIIRILTLSILLAMNLLTGGCAKKSSTSASQDSMPPAIVSELLPGTAVGTLVYGFSASAQILFPNSQNLELILDSQISGICYYFIYDTTASAYLTSIQFVTMQSAGIPYNGGGTPPAQIPGFATSSVATSLFAGESTPGIVCTSENNIEFTVSCTANALTTTKTVSAICP